MPYEVTCCSDPVSGMSVAYVHHLCIFKGDENVTELVDQGVLPLHLPLMHLEASVMLSEAFFVPFLPDFDHWVEGSTLVEGSHILRSPHDTRLDSLILRGGGGEL